MRGILKTSAMVVRRKPVFVPLMVQLVPTQMAPSPTRKPASVAIRPARLKQDSFAIHVHKMKHSYVDYQCMVCAATNNKKDIHGDSRTFPVLSHSVKKKYILFYYENY